MVQSCCFCTFCPANSDSYFIVLVWQWSLCAVEEFSVGQTIVQSTLSTEKKVFCFMRFFSGGVRTWLVFSSGQRVRGREVSECSDLLFLAVSLQHLYFFLVTDDAFSAGDQNSSTVCLLYTHTHTWCNAPLLRPPLILCKFHQWVKSLVCCVVHVSCACIPSSGSLNISSYVRSTSSQTDRERR